ncbi:hypothetical protein BTL55_02150 [Bordetella trematum]|uniref:hypothetical protein n=1 Tax=Bordetella trematum TaxID=123899 RepID=UPI000C78189B|nr:hypothetical protein [Bordetella trematum]AUL45909.1 hypothetical protein BTL55_02150 [Bordetella trematum]
MSGANSERRVGIYFSDFFEVDKDTLEAYGAFNVSLVNDLPLFIDPFLLFDSENEVYQDLHEQIIAYLKFLRDVSATGALTKAHIDQWFRFAEVKQNWLGFSRSGNSGSGLGAQFADTLHRNLHHVFHDFGTEKITKSSHLEKLCLLSEGVGRDHLSDFVTNLIKKFLLDYTQTFAKEYLRPELVRTVGITRVEFNYKTKRWIPGKYDLPFINNDYVILTPKDMLTRDEAWINRGDLLDGIEEVYQSIPNQQLRNQIDTYFMSRLAEDATDQDRKRLAAQTVEQFPIILDHFIRAKEDTADEAHRTSKRKVADTQTQFVDEVSRLVREHLEGTAFYTVGNSFTESMARVKFLKDVIEHKDGWRIFYINGKPITQEAHLQLLYRLTWFASRMDVNREVNNGRGPVDYKVSEGSSDKTLVEFKLARNKKLKTNLQNQVSIYEKANDTSSSITVILYFTDSEWTRVIKIMQELGIDNIENIVLIDGRSDNKPSASTAK